MQPPGERSAAGETAGAAHLRALLDLARLLRGDFSLPEMLEQIGRILSDGLGFATVVLNLYREDTDTYVVSTVHGDERARKLLLGHVARAHTWAPMLDPRFLHGGSYFIPAGALEWDAGIPVYTPEIQAPAEAGDGAWHPEDALFATLDGAAGRRYGIISVDQPRDGRRPDAGRLEMLSAIAAHAAQTIENATRFAQLQSASERHRAVIESSLDAVVAIDSRGRVLEFNPSAEEIFGYRTEDVIGRELATLIVPPEDRDAHRRGLERGFARGRWGMLGRRVELIGMRADGRRLPVELTLTLVKDGGGGAPVVYGFIRDISERRRGEEQLAYLAYHDPLTSLPNRALVEQQLDLAVARARRANAAVALMFVDLDDFKEVNDQLGHAAGDQLLTGVAARLRGVLRDSDVLARQGGDEFLVLVSDLTGDPVLAAEHVGAKLLGSLREPLAAGGVKVRTGASIGVSLYPADAVDAEGLLRHADAAMYRAKGEGGGRLAFHLPTGSITARRTSISAQLRQAVRHNELELHYQPIWRLGPQPGIDGVEALLRWRHPDRGLLHPAAFMTFAEQSTAADEVIDWVLAQACRHAANWRSRGLNPRIGLNVSHHQLLAGGFAERFVSTMCEHGLDPGGFLIELTESAWTVDADETLAVVSELRDSGTTFAIDDFGAGFSSLTRLRELAFDVIKLDRRAIAGVSHHQTSDAVLRAIVGLARACEAEIMAEGVATDEQLQVLARIGIELAQGDLFGQPASMRETTLLLERRLLTGRPAV